MGGAHQGVEGFTDSPSLLRQPRGGFLIVSVGVKSPVNNDGTKGAKPVGGELLRLFE